MPPTALPDPASVTATRSARPFATCTTKGCTGFTGPAGVTQTSGAGAGGGGGGTPGRPECRGGGPRPRGTPACRGAGPPPAGRWPRRPANRRRTAPAGRPPSPTAVLPDPPPSPSRTPPASPRTVLHPGGDRPDAVHPPAARVAHNGVDR